MFELLEHECSSIGRQSVDKSATKLPPPLPPSQRK